MKEQLASFGGSVKALGDGVVEGLLVVFSDESSKDLTGDFFTKETKFNWEGKEKRTALYGHGRDETLQLKELGTGWELKRIDDVGLWVSTQLDMRNEYESAIYGMAEKGKLGLSSGAAGHMVVREGNGEIKQWPIAEGSFTPIPAEPRTTVMAVKDIEVKAFLEMTEEGKSAWSAQRLLEAASWLFDSALILKAKGSKNAEVLVEAIELVKKVAKDELREKEDLPDFDTSKTLKSAAAWEENRDILKAYRAHMTALRDLLEVETLDGHKEQLDCVFEKARDILATVKEGKPAPTENQTGEQVENPPHKGLTDQDIAIAAATAAKTVYESYQGLINGSRNSNKG